MNLNRPRPKRRRCCVRRAGTGKRSNCYYNHWRYERETRLFSLEEGHRSSRRGYADFANRAGAEAAA